MTPAPGDRAGDELRIVRERLTEIARGAPGYSYPLDIRPHHARALLALLDAGQVPREPRFKAGNVWRCSSCGQIDQSWDAQRTAQDQSDATSAEHMGRLGAIADADSASDPCAPAPDRTAQELVGDTGQPATIRISQELWATTKSALADANDELASWRKHLPPDYSWSESPAEYVVELIDRNDDLEAALAHTQTALDAMSDWRAEVNQRAEKAESALGAANADAGRMDWCEREHRMCSIGGVRMILLPVRSGAPSLRSAIDAALAAAPGAGS